MNMRWMPPVALGLFVLVASLGAEVIVVPVDDGKSAAVTFTFQAPQAKAVAIGGTWNDWSDVSSPMGKSIDGLWTWTTLVPASAVLEYKFVVDGEWMSDPNAPAQKDDGFGSSNGLVAVKKFLPAVAAKAPAAVPADNPKNLGFRVEALEDGKTVRVTFRDDAPAAKAVFLAGTMNNWDKSASPMVKGADGVWTGSCTALKDDVLLYLYVTDGQWLYDPFNPARRDSGMGGYNSVADVAQALSGGKPASASGLNFGNYMDLKLRTRFLTKNIKDGTKDGYELDSVDILTGSDWTLFGEILPGIPIFADLKVLNGGVPLFKANSLGTEDPIVSWNQGLLNLADVPFRPFSALGRANATNDINSANPFLGTLKVKLESDYLNLATGYGWAKGTNYSPALWMTSAAAQNDANDGFLEIGLGRKLQKPGDTLKLDAVVAPNKRDGYGVYSWTGFQAGDLSAGLAFNTKSLKSDLGDFFQKYQTMISVGSSFRFDRLTWKAQVLQSTPWGPESLTSGGIADNGAAGVSVQYTDSVASVLVKYQVAGLYATSLYGDDTQLNTGSQTLFVAPTVTLGALMFGFDTTWKAKNDFGQMWNNDLTSSVTPYFGVALDGLGLAKVRADVYGTMDLNWVGGTDFGYRLDQLGVRLLDSGPIGPFQKFSLFYTLTATYFDYDSSGKTYPLNKLYNVVLAQAGVGSDMNLLAGFCKRDLSDNSFQTVSASQLVPYGVALGWTWKIPSAEWKKPLLYAQYTWRLDPFDWSTGFNLPSTPINPSTGLLSGTSGWGSFAPSTLDTNDSILQVGLQWQF